MTDNRTSKAAQVQRRGPAPCVLAWILAALIGLNAAKCIAFAAVGQPPLEGDAVRYWSLSENMAGGDWLLVKDGVEIDRTPGYLLFLAVFHLALGRYALIAATVTQQLIVFATALVTGHVCRRVTGSVWGGAAGLLLSLICVSRNGIALFMVSDTLFCFTLTLCVAALVEWQLRPSLVAAVGMGLLLGLATLVRPIAQFAVLPIFAAMLLQRWCGRLGCKSKAGETPARHGAPPLASGKLFRHAAVFAVCFAAVLAPWLIRGYEATGRCFLSQAGGLTMWQSLYRGSVHDRLNPALPFADTPQTAAVLARLHGVDLQKHHAVLDALEASGLSPMESRAAMQAVCLDTIRAYPWRFVDTRLRRFVWFWFTPNGIHRPATATMHLFQDRPADDDEPGPRVENYGGADWWRWDGYFRDGEFNWFWFVSPWAYLAVAGLSACGLVVMFARREQRLLAAALAMLLVYFAAMTAVGAPPEYRYRMILEPILIVVLVQWLYGPVERTVKTLTHRYSAARSSAAATIQGNAT